ncbi:MAG: nickel insertion protein, partial [Geminicoccaceae bacterium]
MRHLHLDPLGGLAGDMFLAAVLDTFPEFEAGTIDAMRAAGLPEAWRVDLVPHHDGAFAGRRLVIEGPEGRRDAPAGAFGEIRARVAGAPLERPVRERALAIFALLADAEAAVHGIAVEEVHFHELADWDSLADIVGAAWLIDALGGASWSCAALPRGGGRVETRHGPLPVPAPATARLLEGFSMVDDGIAG